MHKIVLVISVVSLLFAVYFGWFWHVPNELNHVPDVTLRIIDGREINLKNLQGRPVLVTFWATTCRGCIKEIPHLKALYEELAPKGLEIIGVAMAYDPPNQILAMSIKERIPYTIALDIDGNIANAFGNIVNTPTSFLISPDGKIVVHNIGEINMQSLRESIITILSAQEKITSKQTS